MTGRVDQSSTEERLRDALGALASEVRPSPVPYPKARADWRRRERRRKLILAFVTAAMFVVADLVGVWALNNVEVDSGVIFSEPTTSVEQQPAGSVGQP